MGIVDTGIVGMGEGRVRGGLSRPEEAEELAREREWGVVGRGLGCHNNRRR
jgi:hypothetical protein